MNNQEINKIPASGFKNLADEIDEISKTKLGSHYDTQNYLEDISEKVEKVIEVNVQLQQKITKLGESITELAREIKSGKTKIPEGVQENHQKQIMPQGVPPVPKLTFSEEKKPEKETTGKNFIEQLKILTGQNMEVINSLKKIMLLLTYLIR